MTNPQMRKPIRWNQQQVRSYTRQAWLQTRSCLGETTSDLSELGSHRYIVLPVGYHGRLCEDEDTEPQRESTTSIPGPVFKTPLGALLFCHHSQDHWPSDSEEFSIPQTAIKQKAAMDSRTGHTRHVVKVMKSATAVNPRKYCLI